MRGHHLAQFDAVEVECRAVVSCIAGRESAVDERAIDGASALLAVVVGAEASRQEPEAVVERVERDRERVGHTAREPAVRSGAHASEHRSALPGRAKRAVETVEAPDGERVRGVAARDIDHVLARQLLDRLVGNAEQAQAAGLAVSARERLEERSDRPVGVPRRRRDEAHARSRCIRERQHEVVERRASIGHEASAAHRHDLTKHAPECRFPPQMRYVFDFAEGSGGGRELLGGKGIGLAEMTALGVPVPDGFTITTEACRDYLAAGGDVPTGLDEEIDERIAALEARTGKGFGDDRDPLLVSVRSGAAVSMPGMMDTILNLGLNDVAVEGLAATTDNPRFALDSYRRLIQMYGEVVDEVAGHRFEQALTDLKAARGVSEDVDLTADDLRELVATFAAIYEDETGRSFPQEPREQLRRAYRAVFDSWNAPRAQAYRSANDIPHDLGTAVNVVQMVFGNRGEASGTGVCFTRDPATGERRLYGEFLSNAQGEDVVAGIRTPEPIERMRERMPEAFDQLVDTLDRLEAHYRDLQDIEFTVEEGTLYLLQTRTGKRTAAAALRVAAEMVDEGLISREEAVARIDPGQLDQLLHPMIDRSQPLEIAATGLNASPGAAVGAIVLDAKSAEEQGKAGEAVILVRWETTPDDYPGMHQAQGILTSHGGMTSHAAVVARGEGTPCIVGCEALSIDLKAKTIMLGEHELSVGDMITIDGGTGEVIIGAVPLVPPAIDENFGTILGWADELRRLKVRANADTPTDAAKAREFGAEGIGLCRTEHMFMAEDRLPIVREMILARDEEERRTALDRLLRCSRATSRGSSRRWPVYR